MGRRWIGNSRDFKSVSQSRVGVGKWEALLGGSGCLGTKGDKGDTLLTKVGVQGGTGQDVSRRFTVISGIIKPSVTNSNYFRQHPRPEVTQLYTSSVVKD